MRLSKADGHGSPALGARIVAERRDRCAAQAVVDRSPKADSVAARRAVNERLGIRLLTGAARSAPTAMAPSEMSSARSVTQSGDVGRHTL